MLSEKCRSKYVKFSPHFFSFFRAFFEHFFRLLEASRGYSDFVDLFENGLSLLRNDKKNEGVAPHVQYRDHFLTS
ncbi:hypothetical protein AS158_07315 [Thermotoga sp. 38H-to]|nr:hypothetical protein AS158_07315 [Thermotoga sp. 38H-to]